MKDRKRHDDQDVIDLYLAYLAASDPSYPCFFKVARHPNTPRMAREL